MGHRNAYHEKKTGYFTGGDIVAAAGVGAEIFPATLMRCITGNRAEQCLPDRASKPRRLARKVKPRAGYVVFKDHHVRCNIY